MAAGGRPPPASTGHKSRRLDDNRGRDAGAIAFVTGSTGRYAGGFARLHGAYDRSPGEGWTREAGAIGLRSKTKAHRGHRCGRSSLLSSKRRGGGRSTANVGD